MLKRKACRRAAASADTPPRAPSKTRALPATKPVRHAAPLEARFRAAIDEPPVLVSLMRGVQHSSHERESFLSEPRIAAACVFEHLQSSSTISNCWSEATGSLPWAAARGQSTVSGLVSTDASQTTKSCAACHAPSSSLGSSYISWRRIPTSCSWQRVGTLPLWTCASQTRARLSCAASGTSLKTTDIRCCSTL